MHNTWIFNTSRIISRVRGWASLLAAHLSLLVPLVPDNWRLYAEYKHCSISVVPFIVPLNNLARLSRVGASVTRVLCNLETVWQILPIKKKRTARWDIDGVVVGSPFPWEGNWNGSLQGRMKLLRIIFNPCARFFFLIKLERVEFCRRIDRFLRNCLLSER